MNKKLTLDDENIILQLSANGITQKEIAKIIGVHKNTIGLVLKKYRVPEKNIIQKNDKKEKSINQIISLRLMYHCYNIDLLTDMMLSEAKASCVEKIYIPERIKKIIDKEKIKKIVSLLNKKAQFKQIKVV